MKKRYDVLFLLPAMIGLLVFWVVPFVMSLGYAFVENAFSMRFSGLHKFKELFENTYFWLAMNNTLLFSGLAVIVILVLSVVLALLIARYALRRSFLRGALFLPVLLPSATIVMLWNAYFAEVPPMPTLLCMYLWKYLGLNVMLILTAVTSLNRDMLDVAQIDGAGEWCQNLCVILPNITPTLFFVFVLSLVNALKIYRESYLLWGGYPDEEVYMLQNYLDNHFAKLNYPNIAAAATIFAVILYSVIAVVYGLFRRWEKSVW